MGRTIGSSKEKSRIQVLEAAARCLSRSGHRKTTFQSIATEAGVSAALVAGHFQTVNQIYIQVLNYVIERAIATTEDRLIHQVTVASRLRAYVRVSFDMIAQNEDHSNVYMMMHYFSLFDESVREINARVKERALSRIELILKSTTANEITISEVPEKSRTIHDLIVGSVISLMSFGMTDIDKRRDVVEKSVLTICSLHE